MPMWRRDNDLNRFSYGAYRLIRNSQSLPGGAVGSCQSDGNGSPSDDNAAGFRGATKELMASVASSWRDSISDLSSPECRPQFSETAETRLLRQNALCRAGNATQDLSLHASGFSLYVRDVAFGQRLRLFCGRVCPWSERAGLPDRQHLLACSQRSGSTMCHLTRIRTKPGGNSRD